MFPMNDTMHSVTYKVGGTARVADVALLNEQGEIEQQIFDLPFEYTFHTSEGSMLYCAAQNTDKQGGTVICEIYLNDDQWAHAITVGFGEAAICSGFASP